MPGISVKFRTVAVGTVLLPLFGFGFCVFWSVVYNFKSATATHCRVLNYLPSLSAAIGQYTPQRHVWRFVIALHTIPRIHVAKVYYYYYQSILNKISQKLASLNCVLNLIEICGLFGLTFISSTDNYKIHKTCFITFLVSSTLYMALSLYLLAYHRRLEPNSLELKSFRIKRNLFVTTLVSIAASMYFFARHNIYCEPLMYTWFALCEYLVVLSNMAFHMTAYWDFYDFFWNFKPESMIYRQQLPFRT